MPKTLSKITFNGKKIADLALVTNGLKKVKCKKFVYIKVT